MSDARQGLRAHRGLEWADAPRALSPALAPGLATLLLLVLAGASAVRAQCTTDADCEDNFDWCTYNHQCLISPWVPEGTCFQDFRCSGGFDNCDDANEQCICAYDWACDDGLLCNGLERCLPADPSAQPNGCVAGSAPCQSPCTCDEGTQTCGGPCAPVDADGDGHASITTGGDDCDDTDPDRFPGNTEVCDLAIHDEDCDPLTFGSRDLDLDGFTDDACCNGHAGTLLCGRDCDDGEAGVNPNNPEVCNGFDDNCDYSVDEGVLVPAFIDGDGDYWGNTGAGASFCIVPPTHAARAGDCAPLLDFAHPGAPERCNGFDDDCDGLIDEGYPVPCP